jgi:hypothetical protein
LIVVLGNSNDLYYIQKGNIVFYHKCVTWKNWFGNEPGSNKTPIGLHKIINLIGDDLDPLTKFKWRKPVGSIKALSKPGQIQSVIISRILQLDGLEPENKNTKNRHIYIHWTPNVWYWETDNLKRSHWCIDLPPDKVIELFNLVKSYKEKYNLPTFVYIVA